MASFCSSGQNLQAMASLRPICTTKEHPKPTIAVKKFNTASISFSRRKNQPFQSSGSNYAKSTLKTRLFAEIEDKLALEEGSKEETSLIGEDAAVFDISEQKLTSWVKFLAVLTVVLGILYFIWLSPETGYGTAYLDFLASFSDSLEVTHSCNRLFCFLGSNFFKKTITIRRLEEHPVS